MVCAFDYCIYNRDLKCILEKVEINGAGMCDYCIKISLDENFLSTEKERQLQEINNR